jgi:hypothetical protein
MSTLLVPNLLGKLHQIALIFDEKRTQNHLRFLSEIIARRIF